MARRGVEVIRVGWEDTIKFLSDVDRSLFVGTRVAWKRKLLNNLAKASSRATKGNIRTQGHGTWAKLSKWTRARTGRRKALSGQEKNVRPKLSRTKAMRSAVIFRSPGNWTLTQHHDGFTEQPTNKVIKVLLKKPGIIGLKGKKEIFFKDDKVTKVPARKIWPEGAQLDRIIASTLIEWVSQYKSWLDKRRSKKTI